MRNKQPNCTHTHIILSGQRPVERHSKEYKADMSELGREESGWRERARRKKRWRERGREWSQVDRGLGGEKVRSGKEAERTKDGG